MTTPTTSTLSLVNQNAIVEALRAHGPLSRPEIGEHTGLSAATISRLTALLIAEQVVVHDGVAPSTGGRPSIMLRYTGAYRVVAAVKVEPGGLRAALVDFDGKIVHRLFVELEAGVNKAASPEVAMSALVDRLVRKATKLGTPCVAVGISVPFTVYSDGRLSGTDDDTEWIGLTARDLVDPELHIPVFVENDANALAIGELYNGVGKLSPHFAAITLARGLGAGIVTNGALYRGSRSAAGEIGYLLLGDLSHEEPYPRGDLETRLGVRALSAKARARALPVRDADEVTVSEILCLARGGNAAAGELASEALDIIARAIAAISSVLDPEFVVLGEGLDEHADFVIPEIERRLAGRIFRVPRLKVSALREDAVLLGAAELAMRTITQTPRFAG